MRGKKPKERERYVLYTNGLLVEVTKEVYLEWYQSRRREKYQIEKQKKHGVCSLEAIGPVSYTHLTRDHVKQIYDFQTGCVKPECLQEGWQTSGSVKIIRMAFNLYCNGTPSIYNFEDSDLEGQLQECSLYTVEEIFCCDYARYFWEAVRIRYPEYCFYVDWEDSYVEN